jgi:ABC-type glycerol-3-phosphate transport system substrate-binding protein
MSAPEVSTEIARTGRQVTVTAVVKGRLAAGVVAALAAGAALTSGTLPARGQSLDELYAKAKAKDEGALAFYAGGPTAPWEARAKAFAERYPGIKVSIGGGFSNLLDRKIDQQMAAQKLEVDAAILQTVADSCAGRRQAGSGFSSQTASTP